VGGKPTFGNEEIEIPKVQRLLILGADVNFRNIDGLTPLNFAVGKCSIILVKLLLYRGAYVSSRNFKRETALYHVFNAGFRSPLEVREVVSLLIRHGADVNVRDSAGYTPLHEAMDVGNSRRVTEGGSRSVCYV
jgi:ankyrin repeat protein